MANISFLFLFGCKICTGKSLHYMGFSEASTDTFLKQRNCSCNKDFLKYLLIFQIQDLFSNSQVFCHQKKNKLKKKKTEQPKAEKVTSQKSIA